MRWSASPGSMPSSSARTARASAYTSRASWLRCSRCRAVISCAHSRSRVGCSAVAARSSSTASPCRPSRSSCSKRSSSAPMPCREPLDRPPRERHVLDPGEHRPAPHRQGSVQRLPGPRPAAARGPGDQPLELHRVDVGGLDDQAQTCRPSLEGRPGAVGPDPVDQRLQRARRGTSAPQSPAATVSAATVSPGVSASSATRARSRLPPGVAYGAVDHDLRPDPAAEPHGAQRRAAGAGSPVRSSGRSALGPPDAREYPAVSLGSDPVLEQRGVDVAGLAAEVRRPAEHEHVGEERRLGQDADADPRPGGQARTASRTPRSRR